MRRFVFWTGISSALAGVGLQFEPVLSRLFPMVQPGMMLRLFGIMAIFLGIMLVLCSRDLQHRGALVAWEGTLRLGGFAIMASFGFFRGGNLWTALCALVELSIGLAYLIFLPRYLRTSLLHLLLDQFSE